ncbi:hypothetical protein [Mycoplasmoides gallisepticum]|uniref:hypothetical protein n=1 Tax=Mycoplasmoides gallisepticum TaxID=2096 RepID=UPI003704B062
MPTLVEVNITNRNLLLAIQSVIIRRNISSIGSGDTFPSWSFARPDGLGTNNNDVLNWFNNRFNYSVEVFFNQTIIG